MRYISISIDRNIQIRLLLVEHIQTLNGSSIHFLRTSQVYIYYSSCRRHYSFDPYQVSPSKIEYITPNCLDKSLTIKRTR